MAASASTPAFQSLRTRLAVLACFWLALLLSVPSWIRLTTIERLPLPTHEVEQLTATHEKCPVTFAASLTVRVDTTLLPTAGSQGKESAEVAFLQQVEELVQQSLAIKAELPAAASLECSVWDVSATALGSPNDEGAEGSGPAGYTIRVLNEALYPTRDIDSPPKTVASVYLGQDEALPLVPDAVSAAVIAELLHLRGDELSTSNEEGGVADTQQDPRVIQYSKHIRLVFSIMNQNAADTTAYDSALVHNLARTWDDAEANPIARLRHELRELHDFHVETQVQWFAPLPFAPTHEVLEQIVEREVEKVVMVETEMEEEQDPRYEAEQEAEEVELELGGGGEEGTKMPKGRRVVQVPKVERVVEQVRTALPPRHVVEWDDLKVFVNSEEWSLTSTVPPTTFLPSRFPDGTWGKGRSFDLLSQTRDLHFLLYIPSRSSSPLYIRNPTTGEMSPHSAWLIPQWGGVVILNLPHTNVSEALEVGGKQGGEGKVRQLPSEEVEEAIEVWSRQLRILLGLGKEGDLQVLKQRRTLELARESTQTLQAIVRLVGKIQNLGVGDQVQEDTKDALAILESLPRPMIDLDAGLKQVQRAAMLANRAFFNPKMLGLLYFPDEHKYAVYTPLFAPLLVPLVVTTIKLLKIALTHQSSQKTPRRKSR